MFLMFGSICCTSRLYSGCGVIYHTKIVKSRQITTLVYELCKTVGCDLSHKNSKIKANHNLMAGKVFKVIGVIYHTKIVKSRQITTVVPEGNDIAWCDLSHKNSKIKANHNKTSIMSVHSLGVIYHTKIVKSRQITTYRV